MTTCNHTPFNLEELHIIGGNYKEITIKILNIDNGNYLSGINISVNFSLIEYKNRYGDPLLSKNCEISSSDNTTFILSLQPEETNELCGVYIYQFSVQTSSGKQESFQGLITIDKNINPDAFATT